MNTEFTKMINCYENNTVATSYIIGFNYKSKLYAIKVPSLNKNTLRLEKASRNQGESLRLRLVTADKINYINMGAVIIGNQNDLLDSKWNKGVMFEKIITEKFGQEWHKDTVPFWEDGDITVNGEKIQIKFNGASLLNTKQMERLI